MLLVTQLQQYLEVQAAVLTRMKDIQFIFCLPAPSCFQRFQFQDIG